MPVMDLGEPSEVVSRFLHEQLAATADKGETLAWFICPGLLDTLGARRVEP
jgi:hypothetical protein